MAVLSAYTIIRSLAIFHITSSFFFLTNPQIIVEQNVVEILGAAMDLPTPRGFDAPSASTAFIAVLLAFFGLADLTAATLPDEVADIYWGTQTPVRLLFLFMITGYTYTFKEDGLFARSGTDYRVNAGDNLKNSLVFTWGFLELSAWMWVFVTLRDERRQRAVKLIEKARKEEDTL